MWTLHDFTLVLSFSGNHWGQFSERRNTNWGMFPRTSFLWCGLQGLYNHTAKYNSREAGGMLRGLCTTNTSTLLGLPSVRMCKVVCMYSKCTQRSEGSRHPVSTQDTFPESTLHKGHCGWCDSKPQSRPRTKISSGKNPGARLPSRCAAVWGLSLLFLCRNGVATPSPLARVLQEDLRMHIVTSPLSYSDKGEGTGEADLASRDFQTESTVPPRSRSPHLLGSSAITTPTAGYSRVVWGWVGIF